MTTPQPSPRDIEQAGKLACKLVVLSMHNTATLAIAQALAQREAEVRAEYAAFADENGKPMKAVGETPIAVDVPPWPHTFSENADAAIAARKETP
jgi:hypothetical protein